MTSFSLSKTDFGGSKTLIIAEAGVNHNGDLGLAKRLIDGAVLAKADAVKFQLFEPEKLTSRTAPLAAYQTASEKLSEQPSKEMASQQDLLRSLALPREAFIELQHYAQQAGILFLCTPFDEESALFLHHELQLPGLKISSGEVTNLPFLKMLGSLDTPILLSTGMATLDEVRQGTEAIRCSGSTALLGLLHCVSAYPAPVEAVNLKALRTLRETFPECVIGYSDHTLGLEIPMAAVALGARIIEKHFTLDKSLSGPDHKASLDVAELTSLVQGIRVVESAMGDGVKKPQPCEQDCIKVARKSLVAARDLPAGHILGIGDIAIKRPGTGISPALLTKIIGLPLGKPILEDDLIPFGLLGSNTAHR